MNPNRCCAVPFIGLAYHVMMMSYMTSWVFICDVIIRMSHYNIVNGGAHALMQCVRGCTQAKKVLNNTQNTPYVTYVIHTWGLIYNPIGKTSYL